MAYRFRPGVRVGNVKPDAAAQELARIAGVEGGLRPKAVVDHSRPDDAPLHPVFVWDDDEAAERYREIQARNLIRAVVWREERADETYEQTVYVHVPADGKGEGEYRHIATVVDWDQAAIERATNELTVKLLAAERALAELREAITRGGQPPSVTAIEIATQGFSAVREALRILTAAKA